MKISYNTPIIALRALVFRIENPILRNEIENWIDDNILEIGWFQEVTKYALLHMKNDKNKYTEHQKKKCALEISKKLLESCGTTETYETPYGERTEYRILGIRALL